MSVSYSPAATGPDAGNLNLTSDDVNNPQSVDVPLSGNGVQPPVNACNFSVAPTSLAFGSVNVGSTSTQSTTVTNNGTADCSIAASVAGSAAFTLNTASPVTVAANGGTASVSVSYAPTAAGADAGNLSLVSNDATNPQNVSVALSGTGVDVAVCTGLNITQSSWSNRRNRLTVEGDGGQRNGGDFVLTNAYDATQVLATGSRNRDREFRFRVTRPTPVPCTVRVEQPNTGLCAIADVSNAPANCGPVPPPPNLPPVSDPNGPYMGIEGQPVSFDGSGSYDPDGTIVSYDWNFGDGNTGSGVSPSHTYAAAGSYIVNLTVTDDDGASDTATTTAVIDTPPVGGGVTARGDLYSTPVGNPITVTATRLSGVLYNDFGGVAPLTAELLSGPSSGSLSAFGADGSFTYSPGAAMTDNAIDQFTYQAVDANGATSAPGHRGDPGPVQAGGLQDHHELRAGHALHGLRVCLLLRAAAVQLDPGAGHQAGPG